VLCPSIPLVEVARASQRWDDRALGSLLLSKPDGGFGPSPVWEGDGASRTLGERSTSTTRPHGAQGRRRGARDVAGYVSTSVESTEA